MGSGKTTIGKFVASDMKWQFIDMDSYFEQKHDCTISQFFANHGEESFREAEHKVLEDLCQLNNVIVATGGGAPCFYNNMELMNASGATIYINVEPQELANRLSNAKVQRPLIANKSNEELLDFIGEQLTKRETHYRKAHMVVDGMALPFTAYRTLIEYFPEDFNKDE